MRRTIWIVPLLAGGVLAAVLLLKPAPSPAIPGRAEAAASPAPAPAPGGGPGLAQLPIKHIVLFSSGVGYFQRDGQVEGSTRIDLSFPVDDINDLLKSMVLQDLGGGHISAVNCDSHDPIDRTLKSFAVDLTSNPTFSQILNQGRGEKVEVVTQQSDVTQGGTQTGTIVGVEKQHQRVGKDGILEVEMLNLWNGGSMRSVRLNDVQRIHFVNPVMDREFSKALQVLALSHDTQKKTVSLTFSGQGKRPVQVGYVVANPIWKTSYRLLLDKEGKSFLQGWGVVENPTDEDWSNVHMTLVSGRPISFRMDLYQPLYVPRPMVQEELFASLQPQVYGGGMGGPGMTGPAPTAPAAAIPPQPGMIRLGVKQDMERKAGADRLMEAEMPPQTPAAGEAARFAAVNQSVISAAAATNLGDSFQYIITHPVSLPRKKSAMLPIITHDIESTKVSIYNESTLAKFPLLGLKIKNTTGSNLMQGPITVYDGNHYAGDARIETLQPNEERLLSYAIDLGTEVQPEVKQPTERLMDVAINRGILCSTTRLRMSKTYNAKNRTQQDRTLLIEHPYRPQMKVVSKPAPVEHTRDVYRFELKVPAGKTASLDVVEEQDIANRLVLTDSNDQSLGVFLSSRVTSAPVKEALRKAMTLKNAWSTTKQELGEVDNKLRTITTDQQRLRDDIKVVPKGSEPYKRYLDKFNTQETQIEKLQAQQENLRDTLAKQRKDYESYVQNLTVGECGEKPAQK